MYTLINGSCKPSSSNSLKFLNEVSEFLDKYVIYDLKKDKYNIILDNINISDTIIIAFPLYVDSPPSLILEFFDYIIDNKITFDGKKMYVIVNCGFREGEQNITSLNIVKNWCDKVLMEYSGSILIGAGEVVGNSKCKLISKNAIKNLKHFSSKIALKENSNDMITSVDYLNNNMYCMFANYFWHKKCRKNKLKKNDILIK